MPDLSTAGRGGATPPWMTDTVDVLVAAALLLAVVLAALL